MFLRGSFQLSEQAKPVSVLPQQAVMLRDGGAFVFVVEPDLRVRERRVTVGRRYGDQIEIIEGLASAAQVVETGGAFLVEGDTVRVITPNRASPRLNPLPHAGERANVSLREGNAR
jgi:multidrug efflux pump subunit AcrA (membrane-fusion protein)